MLAEVQANVNDELTQLASDSRSRDARGGSVSRETRERDTPGAEFPAAITEGVEEEEEEAPGTACAGVFQDRHG